MCRPGLLVNRKLDLLTNRVRLIEARDCELQLQGQEVAAGESIGGQSVY